jgi:hypothetical protein
MLSEFGGAKLEKRRFDLSKLIKDGQAYILAVAGPRDVSWERFAAMGRWRGAIKRGQGRS